LNGTVGIGWGDVFPSWIKYRSNAGKHLDGMRDRSGQTVNQKMNRAGRFSDRHYYSGFMIHSFNFLKKVSKNLYKV